MQQKKNLLPIRRRTMTAAPKSPSRSRGPPKQTMLRTAFGPPALIDGENPAVYDELAAGIAAHVKPVDILEEIWVRDVIDHSWNMERLRRLKASLMRVAAFKGLERVLEPMMDSPDAAKLASEWYAEDPSAIKAVNNNLASADLSMNEVMAQTFVNNIDSIERIDRMIENFEKRRNAALREVDRHRQPPMRDPRWLAQQVEDGKSILLEDKSRNVTSARKREANRANARASTGPKTADGRTRTARNALRHGLSLTARSAEVFALARDIAGPDATLELQKLSFRIAEAQIELSRVRHARHHLVSRALSNQNPLNLENSQKFAIILSDLAQNLAAMDRYEDRALSRRKSAARAFDQAQKTAATVHTDSTSWRS